MRLHSRFWIAAALLMAASGAASAGVTVKYQDPDKYFDVPDFEKDRTQLLKELSAHFDKLGKDLPAGQQLNITVTDLDLAGRVEPRRRSLRDVRILRGGADWPTMQVQYALEENGKVIASGSDKLSNMMYLDRLNRYPNGDSLRYEKQMVDEWFKGKFGPTQLSKQ